jgi:hypothetical protein
MFSVPAIHLRGPVDTQRGGKLGNRGAAFLPMKVLASVLRRAIGSLTGSPCSQHASDYGTEYAKQACHQCSRHVSRLAATSRPGHSDDCQRAEVSHNFLTHW